MTAPSPFVSEAFAWPGTVDPRAVAYIEGYLGESGVRNVAAWRDLQIVPRVLRDVTEPSTVWPHAGRSFSAPIVVAPWASQTFVHPDGERATALGAARAGVPFGLSSNSATLVSDLPHGRAPFWVQLYVPPTRQNVVPFVRAAEEAGALGFLVTLDAPPAREGYAFRDDIAGIVPPSVNFPGGGAPIAPDLGPSDLRWLASLTSLPIWVKGVLSPLDVPQLLDLGLGGLIVSNHGGRQLAGVVSTARALPGVVEAVDGRAPVWVDGGIRSGEDIFRALALGAEAVLIGRPAARALTAGAGGVAAVVDSLREELRVTMAMAGTPTLADIVPSSLAL